MKQIKYVVSAEEAGLKIKDILRNKLSISAAVLTKLKKSKRGILCNGEEVFAVKRVCDGDEIEINLADERSANIVPAKVKLDIIHEDEDILVVNKPRSMPTHPSQNHHSDSLANAVVGYYSDCPFTFRVITRLDKDTSGVVIIAKNKISAGILTEQMTKKEIEKEYVALCHGVPQIRCGIIDAPIARKAGSAILREVNPLGKEAVTYYEVMESGKNLSVVKLIPKTGRTHQIRVHLSHIGFPIYGDDLYGSKVKNEKVRLHCRKIRLIHPISKEKMEFTAQIPKDMEI